jgi:aconitate hydratase 2/2-methylisocitrate dehydratase
MSMLAAYRAHAAERAALGIPPLPLSAKQTEGLIALRAKRRFSWNC